MLSSNNELHFYKLMRFAIPRTVSPNSIQTSKAIRNSFKGSNPSGNTEAFELVDCSSNKLRFWEGAMQYTFTRYICLKQYSK